MVYTLKSLKIWGVMFDRETHRHLKNFKVITIERKCNAFICFGQYNTENSRQLQVFLLDSNMGTFTLRLIRCETVKLDHKS